MIQSENEKSTQSQKPAFLVKPRLQSLIELLISEGRTVVGPKIEQQAIIYDEITSTSDLPKGWTDQQSPGMYRLEPSKEDAYFGYVVGPHSWKQFLFPPNVTVATAEKEDRGWTMQTPEMAVPSYAFLGVRACEIAAIKSQDRIFLGGEYVDPIYKARRDAVLIIAVNCSQAASTCFCTSMNTGPKCESGYDLCLTEVDDGFVIESGSEAGEEIFRRLETRPLQEPDESKAQESQQRAVDQITKKLNTDRIKELLVENLKSPHWEDVATRCLSCTNCTMVCPTCFCSTVREVSDLSGDRVERKREWDSCFNLDFSYMNGGVVRNTIKSRYRQWLTHKLASWQDQFGESGCVGCGRCITWCPTEIDLTVEVEAIRQSSKGEVLISEVES